MVDVQRAHVTDDNLQSLCPRCSNVQTIFMLKEANILIPITPCSSENNDVALGSLHRVHADYKYVNSLFGDSIWYVFTSSLEYEPHLGYLRPIWDENCNLTSQLRECLSR